MMTLTTTIVEFDLANLRFKNLSMAEFNIDNDDKNKIYWVHCNLKHHPHLHALIKKLNLPDDVTKLCDEADPIPKLIDRDESLTIQAQCLLNNEPHNRQVDFGNLIIHLTDKYCFTAASETLPAIEEFIDNYPKSIRYARTPCFIVFLLFDNIVNDFARILYDFEFIAEKMDVDVRAERTNMYKEVMDVKQEVMKIKRYTMAAREILMRISGRSIAVVSEQCRTSLYNLSNHSHMVVHETDSIRDMLNSLLDEIENMLMQRLHETMRVLTAFAAIFLPLTLITGIYGMNFRWMPELNWKYGYFGALVLLVVCAIGLLIFFKKKKWF